MSTWHKKEKRYGGEDYMTKFQREGKKQPKRIPQWIINTLGVITAIFATIFLIITLCNL